MAYQVLIREKAAKSLEKIDKRIKNKIQPVLLRLRGEPYLGKQLGGELKGYRSIRIWPFRIIYEVQEHQKLIKIVAIGHRQGVYHKI